MNLIENHWKGAPLLIFSCIPIGNIILLPVEVVSRILLYRVHQILNLHIPFLIFYGSLILRLHNTSSTGSSIVIGFKNIISAGSSIMQLLKPTSYACSA